MKKTYFVQALAPSTNYTIRVWARSQPPGLQLSIVNGSWVGRAFNKYTQSGAAFASALLTAEWQLLEASVPAVAGASAGGSLQLRLHGKGMLWLDDTFVAANASSTSIAATK